MSDADSVGGCRAPARHDEVLLVGPEEARALLERNAEFQRKVRPNRVQEYAEEMRAGRWCDNGETIKMDELGRLIDGQHRLRAVIESGTAQVMTVAYGLPADAYKTIDAGLGRRLTDVTVAKAPACTIGKVFCIWEKTGSITGVFSAHMVTRGEVLEYIDGHLDEIMRAVTPSWGLKDAFGSWPLIPYAAAWAVIEDRAGAARAEEFRRILSRSKGYVAENVARDFDRSYAKIKKKGDREALIRLLLFMWSRWELGRPTNRDLSSGVDLHDFDRKASRG